MNHLPATQAYRGRFAPSPSGPLHLGSLVAALGSYLDAKAHGGKWLVRIEDIDPPREVAGASAAILRCLQAHGLEWDESVSYQSQHSEFYEANLKLLASKQLSYACDCTRKMIQQQGGHYTGHCRQRQVNQGEYSQRFLNQHPVLAFDDLHLGRVQADRAFAEEDFIIKRKDGLYAYHLAMVTDDIRQGITHVVRGADLLQPSACQMSLYQALSQPTPDYLHLPVVASKPGWKLSKQNHAPALQQELASNNLSLALGLLNHCLPIELEGVSCEHILQWAITHWRRENLPTSLEVITPPTYSV